MGQQQQTPQQPQRPQPTARPDNVDVDRPLTGNIRPAQRPRRPPTFADYEDTPRRPAQRPNRPAFTDYDDIERPQTRPRPAKRPSRPVFDYEDTGFGRSPQRPSRPFQFDYEEYNEYECEPRAESYREPD